jgi:Bacterial Ig-like domain (group 3)/FG-GAP-like repeat
MGRNSRLLLSALLTIAGTLLPNAAEAAAVSTVTTLALSSPSAASPAAVTLTATVTAGGAPVANGTVTFCNAAATYCEDAAIVGKAQLNGGSAQFKFIPAIGVHNYKAIFNATATAAGSISSVQTLTVTGLYPTTTAIAATGNPSGYQLTATVVGYANHPPVMAGTVSFQDTSDGNFVLGTASLGTPSYAQGFVPAPGSPVPTGNQPAAVGNGDFNGDGKPDLAVMDAYQNAITILLGNGDGTFTEASGSPIPGIGTIPCIVNPSTIPTNCSMAVGDFNHDGNADLVETSEGDNQVFILLGHGDGTFSPAAGSPISVGNFPEAVRIGDFNNDGLLDLAVANSEDNTVSILLGNGNGTFTAAGAPVPVGAFPFYLAVADFNGDGNADIAVSNEGDSTVSVLQGNGDGTFTQAAGSPIPGFNYSPAQVVAADFNRDGIPDLAVADFIPVNQAPPIPSQTSDVVVLLGQGDGTFTPAAGSPITVGLYALAMVAADFNQDGNTDLAVDNYGIINQPTTQTLTLLLGNGDGTFMQAGPPTQLGDSPNDLAAADFNGDGTTDLAIPNVADFNTSVLLYYFTQTATASVSNITVAGTATHYVDAVYLGNTSFATSTSTTVPLLGSQVATTLTLSANPIQQMVTMPVTFTAQLGSVSNEPPFATPTGTVTFYDQSVGVTLGTAPMGANGQAVYTTTSIGPGTHFITASYGGDPTFLPSSANAITVTIDELRILRVGNNNTTILPGTTVVYTLQVMPQVVDTFLYNVSFSASGLPAGATATFSPVTLPAGGKTTNITMTVETAGSASNTPPASPFGRLSLALGLLLPLLGTKAMRGRLRKIPLFLGVVLLAALSLAAVAGLSGCSGAGLFAARKVPYSITVTATEGTVQRSTQVPLAIQ